MQNKLSNKSTTIDEEFESIREMANIEVTDMNTETRTCQIHSECNGYTANLQVTFPKNVSEQTIPKFSWLSGTNVDGPTTIKILLSINRTAYRKKKEGHRCLLHCLKILATSIDEVNPVLYYEQLIFNIKHIVNCVNALYIILTIE